MKKSVTLPLPTARSQADRQTTAWLESFNPLRNLTLLHAQLIFDSARRGNDVRLQWIYENMEQADPTLMICAERRASALVELDWTIRSKAPRRTRGFNETLSEEQAAFLESVYGDAQESNLFPAIEHLAKAFFRGHAHIAPRWSQDRLTLRGFDLLNSWNLCRDVLTGSWYWNPSASETLDFNTLTQVQPDELCTLVRSRHIDYPAMAIYLRNNLGEKAWGQFLERYGIPPVIITMPEQLDPGKVDEYCDRAVLVADGGSGALPSGCTVSYATEARGTNPFKDFLDHQQQLIVLMATGGMLTSLTGATGIGQGATSAHEDTWRTIVRRDAAAIATTINHSITDPLLDRAFPGQPHLARFDFETEPPPGAAEIFDLASRAVTAGYRVTQEDLAERTGYKLQPVSNTPETSLPAPWSAPIPNKAAHHEKPSENPIADLVRALQLDLSPAAGALQTFLDTPTAHQARTLLEQLPSLLPDDPQAVAILEQTIAQTFADEVQEKPIVANSEHCPDCGRWLTGNGSCPDCQSADEAAKQGLNPDPAEVQDAEIGKGKAALTKCLEKQHDIHDALARSDLGTISFIYGDERRGIAHFAHRQDAMEHLPETLIYGKLGPLYEKDGKRNITYGRYTAAIRLFYDGNAERWVVTAFGPEDKKEGNPR